MIKLTDEQQRLLRFLENFAGKQTKSTTEALFSRATMKSLIRKGLITEEDTGYYTILKESSANSSELGRGYIRKGYWNDWTGACHQVVVIAETIDGRYVVDGHSMGLGTMLIEKKDIKW